jgi:hypothetical protein
MKLYIQIKDGKPFQHPIMENNFIEAYSHIDTNNLPPEFAEFKRVPRPILGVYEVFGSMEPTYEFVDGFWTDVWDVQEIPAEQKLAKQQKVHDEWLSMPDIANFANWVFDENSCEYKPPIPAPIDGKIYFWQGTTSSWVETPQYPTDGKNYELDYVSATWVEVIN